MSRNVAIGMVVLAVICSGLFLRSPIASATLHIGNEFFGGSLPYSLPVANFFFRSALLLDPDVEDAWHQRARIAFLRGDFKDARTMINKQIEIHGDSFMASYYIRGLINGYAGRYSDAEADFKHFLTWDPNNWAANNDLAWIYFSEGKYKEVEAQARIGLAHYENNPWLEVMLGMSLFNQGKKDEAILYLENAKRDADKLTEADWHKAYPGNHPDFAHEGLAEFKKAIDANLDLVHK